MTLDPVDIIRIVAMVSVFGLIISLWAMGVWFWALRESTRKKELRERLNLREDAGETRMVRLWLDGEEASTLVPGAENRGLLYRLDLFRREAGLKMSLGGMLGMLGGGTAVTALLLYGWAGSGIAAVIGGATFLVVARVYLGSCVAKRKALFDRQLVDAMDLAARSLRAGHPLGGAFQLVAEEVPDPVGTVFAEVCQQQELGVGHEEAIRRAAEQSRNGDMKLFATSVAIQLRSGGNLADMMRRLAHVIRERIRLSRRVQVLTAQTQFSKNALLAIPFVMLFVLNLMNPEYLEPLFDTPQGHVMLGAASGSLLIGAWLMNRMAQLNV